MEIVKLGVENIEQCAFRAAEVLRAGGVVLYPTDTLYGLGADALSDEAVAKIYAIKGREEKKPIHAIVADIEIAEKYSDINEDARLLAKKFGGQVTLITRKRGIESGIAKGIPTFGFRIPDHPFCTALAQAFDKPITATSANKSGEKPERSIEAILAQLGEDALSIDLVIDAGELPEREPSTVVDFSGDIPAILREGAISAASLHPLLARGTTRR